MFLVDFWKVFGSYLIVKPKKKIGNSVFRRFFLLPYSCTCFWLVFGWFLGGFWEVFERFLGGFWEVFGRFLGGFWEVFGRFLDGFWKVSCGKLVVKPKKENW